MSRKSKAGKVGSSGKKVDRAYIPVRNMSDDVRELLDRARKRNADLIDERSVEVVVGSGDRRVVYRVPGEKMVEMMVMNLIRKSEAMRRYWMKEYRGSVEGCRSRPEGMYEGISEVMREDERRGGPGGTEPTGQRKTARECAARAQSILWDGVL